jgi:hypothetical protein
MIRKTKKEDELIEGYVYVLKKGDIYKIGCTKNLEQRTRVLNNMNGGLGCSILIKSEFYQKIEKTLHSIFKSKRGIGEWFRLNENDLKRIKELYSDNLILRG